MAIVEKLSILLDFSGEKAVAEMKKVGSTAEKELKKGSDSANHFANRMMVAGAAMVATGTLISKALGKMGDDFVAAGKETLKLQRMTGESAETMSRMRFAAQQSGVDVDTLAKGYSMLSKSMLAGKPAFSDLGIATRDANGNLRSTNQVLIEVADKFKTMTNATEKNALAAQIFGRQYMDLMPLLNKGGAEIQKLAAESDKYGLTLTGDNLNAVKEYIRNQRELDATMQGLKVQIGSGVTSALNTLVGPLKSAVGGFQSLSPEVRSTVGAVGTFAGTALVAAGAGVTMIGMLLRAKNAMSEAAAEGGKLGAATKGLAAGTIAIAGLATAYQLWNSKMEESARLAADLEEKIAGKASNSSYGQVQSQIQGLNNQINGLHDEWVAWDADMKSKNPLDNLRALGDADYINQVGNASQALLRQRDALIAQTEAARQLAQAKGISIDQAWQEIQAEEAVKKLKEANPKLSDEEAKSLAGVTEKTKDLTTALQDELSARRKVMDERNKEVDASLGIQGDVADYRQAEAATAAARQKVAANPNDKQAVADLNEAIIRQAEAKAKVAETTAKMSGQELTAGERAALLRDEINKLSAGMPELQNQLAITTQRLDELAQPRTAEIDVRINGMAEALGALAAAAVTSDRAAGGHRSAIDIAAETARNAGVLPGRAKGGQVKAGSTYMVGENGPEPVTFGATGYVHPTGSNTGATYNIDASGLTPAQAADLVAMIEARNMRNAA